MPLSTTLDPMKKSLTRTGGEAVYAQARPRHAAFAPYETVGALLSAVDRGSALSIAKRDAIFAAIVTEHQASSSPFWQSLLLVAFTPMLIKLRWTLERPHNEELDQSVLFAFLEVARSLTFRTYIARNLWLLTRARLFAERRRARRRPDLFAFDEETHPFDPLREGANGERAAAAVIRIIEAEGGDELREVLLEAHGDEGSVKEYVERAYADCGARERARVCKRLCAARRKVFSKIRAEGTGRRALTAAAPRAA